MRRVAYWLKNSQYREVLAEFCHEEGFEFIETRKPAEVKNTVFFLTDTGEILENLNVDKLPLCLISPDNHCYGNYILLNPRLTLYSLRMLMDEIHHGPTCWKVPASMNFISSVKEGYLGNDFTEIEKFIFQLTRELVYFCSFSEIEKMRIGFSEMVTNAIEHGNLNITSQEKSVATENGNFASLMSMRDSNPIYSGRKVYVRTEINRNGIIITVRDEGSGFDVSAVEFPLEPLDLLKLHGRGILITRAYFHSVEYNEKGNEVTLTRFFPEK